MITIVQKVGKFGRIVIPKEIRDVYHINFGDTVILKLEDVKHIENTENSQYKEGVVND